MISISEIVEKTSKEDFRLIEEITGRAKSIANIDVTSTIMDLLLTHYKNPLRLEEMVKADELNLMHDISGIRRHLNRETGDMEDCFLPRFTKGESNA